MDTGRLLPTCEHVFSLIHLVLTFVDINLCVRLVPSVEKTMLDVCKPTNEVMNGATFVVLQLYSGVAN